ncbi:MAG: DUF3810 family protein [Saprospiraceae bacterium]|nr:DUF3810 family protein [Saprospiraceae bacterium]
MFTFSKFDRLCIGIILICVVYGLYLNSLASENIDSNYTFFVFKAYRLIWDWLFQYFNFPLIYLWILAFIAWLGYLFFLYFQRQKSVSAVLIKLTLGIGIHLAFFYLFWGFNYLRTPLVVRLELDGQITNEQIKIEAWRVTEKICSLRNEITLFNEELLTPNIWIQPLHQSTSMVFKKWNIGNFPSAKVHLLKPHGSLLIFGAAGFYWPLSGQGHVDMGLHPLQWPFTYAHELSHAMGWTDEGECNFIAYLACIQSDSPWVKYSAELMYYRYLMAAVKRIFPDEYIILKEQLSPEIAKDLSEINYALNRFPELFPRFREWFYDAYLRMNRVNEGIYSYSNLVKWIILYSAKDIK